MKQWFTSAELAPLMGTSQRSVNRRAASEGWPHRMRPGRGGGREYPISVLPESLQAKLLQQHAPTATPVEQLTHEVQWAHYERAPQAQKDKAAERARILRAARNLAGTMNKTEAFAAIADAHSLHHSTLWAWDAKVNGADASDWLPLLMPAYSGRTAKSDIAPEARDMFDALALRRSYESLQLCYERVGKTAKQKGWAWPSAKTVLRDFRARYPRAAIVLARQGAEAFDRTFPPMQRDAGVFRALQAVNADGLEFRPKILWPDGEICHAKVWAIADIYSRRWLAWNIAKTENKGSVRLAFGVLVALYGIPEIYYVDNTTAVASKWLTGGTPNRYRWKVRDDDPLGIIPQVGTRVSFVSPGRGQSKPIERANKEMRELVDSHPQFHGRGTLARPIPLEEFTAVLEAEIAHFNARTGRRTRTANGSSYDATFQASYAQATIKKATAEQQRLFLLVAEKVRAQRENGSLILGRGPQGENRYWHHALTDYAGKYLVVRFDPAQMHNSVHVYTLDGRYICEAPCTWGAGFNDLDAAREYAKEKARYKKHIRRAKEAEQRMSVATAAKLLVEPETPPTPKAGVVQLTTPARRAVNSDAAAALQTQPDTEIESLHDGAADLLARIAAERKKQQL